MHGTKAAVSEGREEKEKGKREEAGSKRRLFASPGTTGTRRVGRCQLEPSAQTRSSGFTSAHHAGHQVTRRIDVRARSEEHR